MSNKIVHIKKDNTEYDIDVSKITYLSKNEVIRQDKKYAVERIDDYNLNIHLVNGEHIYLCYDFCSQRDYVYEEIFKVWNKQG